MATQGGAAEERCACTASRASDAHCSTRWLQGGGPPGARGLCRGGSPVGGGRHPQRQHPGGEAGAGMGHISVAQQTVLLQPMGMPICPICPVQVLLLHSGCCMMHWQTDSLQHLCCSASELQSGCVLESLSHIHAAMYFILQSNPCLADGRDAPCHFRRHGPVNGWQPAVSCRLPCEVGQMDLLAVLCALQSPALLSEAVGINLTSTCTSASLHSFLARDP